MFCIHLHSYSTSISHPPHILICISISLPCPLNVYAYVFGFYAEKAFSFTTPSMPKCGIRNNNNNNNKNNCFNESEKEKIENGKFLGKLTIVNNLTNIWQRKTNLNISNYWKSTLDKCYKC